MIYVPLNSNVMLRRELSLKSHLKDKVIFPGDRYFCFSFWVAAKLTLSVIVIKTSYSMIGMIYQRESLNCFK